MSPKLISIRSAALAGILLTQVAFCASPSLAASNVTFVSGKGTNSGTCSDPASPCRTFNFAIGLTSPGGEIKALDPANYGIVAITKSVTITGVEGASIYAAGPYGIAVNAGENDVVTIRNLTIEGHKTATRGLSLVKVGSLNLKNCVFTNFVSDGIFIDPKAGTTLFRLADVESSENGGSGFYFLAENSAVTKGIIDRSKFHHNGGGGIYTYRNSNDATLDLVVNASEATNNGSTGFHTGAQGTFALRNSVSTGNAYGVYINTQMSSTGDNLIYGNTTDVAGPLSPITPK